MPYTSGVYDGLVNSWNTAVAGTIIDPSDWNDMWSDIETSFNDVSKGKIYAKTDVASATTCDIGAASTSVVRITGTTTITSLGTSPNTLRIVYFAAALTLTHDATSLILPGGATNITTAAGDTALFISDASGNWRCWTYMRAALVASGDVVGPSSATDNQVVRFDGTTGKLVQAGTTVTLSDSDVLANAKVTRTGGTTARTLEAHVGTVHNILDYGATNSTSVDSRTAIQAAITAAQSSGGIVFVPGGQFRIDSGLTITAPVTIIGVGNGSGPGAVSNTGCSQICANFASGDMIAITTTPYNIKFEGLQFNTLVTRSSGAAISCDLTAGVANNGGSFVRDCAFSGQYIGIYLKRVSLWTIEGNYFQAWVKAAIETDTPSGIEASPGYITNNYLFGDTASGTTQLYGMLIRNGYCWITSNTILGSQVGVYWLFNSYPAGRPLMALNSIEEQTVSSLYIENGGTSVAAAMLQIVDNEFSIVTNGGEASLQSHITIAASASPWATGIQISGNRFRSSITGASAYYMVINSGTQIDVFDNAVDGLTSTRPVMLFGAQASDVRVRDLRITGTTGAKYSSTTAQVQIEDAQGLTFANLPSTIANGSRIWVTDGDPAANTFAGGSTGCWAIRVNGAWIAEVSAQSIPVTRGGTGTGTAGIAAFNNITGLSAAGTTGTTSTNLVFSTSPTLVTPALGTPSSVTLTNATGLPVSTGVSGLGTGVATFLGTPTNANLQTALTSKTTTVASLPSAATAGAGYRFFVTDANATTFASVVAAGGANGVPVYSDGTNWRIG